MTVSKSITLAALISVVFVSACNRAVPDKASAGGDQGSSLAGASQAKPDPAAEAIMPPVANNAMTAAVDAANNQTDNANGSPSNTDSVNNAGQKVPASDGGRTAPGVTIETVATGSNITGASASEPPPDPSLADRSFMKLQLPQAALAPDQLIAFLMEADRAVQELTMARQGNQIGEKLFLEQAKRLSSMKLSAGERLYADSASTAAQKKTAIAARVESLSQLTGLGDVEAATKLLQVAGQLKSSNDPQLAHQGRLVLIGFRLNQLVEGQIKDPQTILDDVNDMLDKSEYRGLVELLALQQSLGVLNQLGYAQQAQQVQQRIIKEFRNSSDRELAMRSWMIEVGNSPELKAVHESIQNTLAGTEKDQGKVADLAMEFIRAYPSLNTVNYFMSVIVDLEYSGHVDASQRLSAAIRQFKTTVPGGPLLSEIDNVLDGQSRRLGALGKPLMLDQLTGMDGRLFDWSSYRGKVVLVYFWASWELPSMNLVDQIKKLRERITDPNFEIVGICTDDGRTITSAEQYVQRQGLSWRNVRSSSPQAVGLESAVAKSLGVNAYSHFAMLVDKSSNVRAVHPSFDKIDAMIQELLSEVKSK